MRLCRILADRWAQLDAAYYQINLLRIKPARMANLVYSWAIERVPHEKLQDWLTELGELLEWQDADSETAVNLESESFFAAAAKGGG